MEKICKRCLESKDIKEYSKHSGFKDGLNTICKICKVSENKKNYFKDPSKHRESKIKRVKVLRNYVFDFLKNKECVDCGNNNPVVLEFDHINDNKIDNISKMIWKAVKIDTLIKEIKKCEIRCANCHRIRTSKINNWFKGSKVD